VFIRTFQRGFFRAVLFSPFVGNEIIVQRTGANMPGVSRTPHNPEPLRRKRPVAGAPLPSPIKRKTIHFLLVFVTLVLVIDALVGEKGLLETVRARREHRDLSASIERLRAENTRLRDEARRLREDPKTIESLAREDLGLIRPGELLFIIKDARPAAERN
jgi:cell division protein FtsB